MDEIMIIALNDMVMYVDSRQAMVTDGQSITMSVYPSVIPSVDHRLLAGVDDNMRFNVMINHRLTTGCHRLTHWLS